MNKTLQLQRSATLSCRRPSPPLPPSMNHATVNCAAAIHLTPLPIHHCPTAPQLSIAVMMPPSIVIASPPFISRRLPLCPFPLALLALVLAAFAQRPRDGGAHERETHLVLLMCWQ